MNSQRNAQTRLITQIGLGLVVLVAVVGAVTFISQYQSPEQKTSANTPITPASGPAGTVRLKFPVVTVQWDPPWLQEFEESGDGHYDFWFENPNAEAVEMGISDRSCTCMAASVCLLSPQDAKRYPGWASSRAAAQLAAASGGLLPWLSQYYPDEEITPRLFGLKLEWHPVPISETEAGAVVEPGYAGLLRLEGKKAKMGTHPLIAPVWTQIHGPGEHPRQMTMLELPISWVPPVRFLPDTLDVQELSPREEKTVEGEFWSGTRKYFPIKMEEQDKDPHVSFSWTPMTEAQRNDFHMRTGFRILWGYKARATVRERIGDSQQMDIGPFNRVAIVNTDANVGLGKIPVTGVVKGEIDVGAEEDHGKILLGNFKAEIGKSKTILLSANRPGLTLEYDRTEPEALAYLKVQPLKPVVTPGVKDVTQWELHVVVPPGTPRRIPKECAVIVKMSSQGSPPRLIRIPVSGTAYHQ